MVRNDVGTMSLYVFQILNSDACHAVRFRFKWRVSDVTVLRNSSDWNNYMYNSIQEIWYAYIHILYSNIYYKIDIFRNYTTYIMRTPNFNFF